MMTISLLTLLKTFLWTSGNLWGCTSSYSIEKSLQCMLEQFYGGGVSLPMFCLDNPPPLLQY